MNGEDDQGRLGATPYFRGLAAQEIAAIQAGCHVRDLQVGEFILLEGAPATALCVVRSGRVRRFKTAANGKKEQVLIVLGPGETFNDVPVFDGGPNPASAQAIAPGTSVLVVPAGLVTELLATNPHVAANVIRVLAGRLRHLTALVGDLAFHDVAQRLTRLLLQESTESGEVTLTQQEMAARVGTAREVVSRVLRQLESRGAISRRHNHGVLVYPAVLLTLIDDTLVPGTLPRDPLQPPPD